VLADDSSASESLLSDDEYDFEVAGSFDVDQEFDMEYVPTDKEASPGSSVLDGLRLSLKGDVAQGKHIDVSRASVGLIYEAVPWQSAYVKVDGKYIYFHQKDRLAESAGSSYSRLKLNEAWLQYSHHQCVAKVGLQSLFWGGVEGSYAVDVINPLIATEPLLTDYSQVRQSQNQLLLNCFLNESEFELFYIPDPRLDRYSHKNRELFDALESQIENEWGVRVTQRMEGFDVSFMYANLYENTPTFIVDPLNLASVSLGASKYDLFGMSTTWALGRLLLEVDLAYKRGLSRNQFNLLNQELVLDSQTEVALGFEYTTSNNHQISAGVWFYESRISFSKTQAEKAEFWNVSWSKQYANDNLTLSMLSAWSKEPERLMITGLSEYDWDDNWTLSSSLSYTDQSSGSSSAPTQVKGFESPFQSASTWSTQLSFELSF